MSQLTLPVHLPYYDSKEVLILSRSTDWSYDFYDIKKVHSTGRKGEGIKVAVLDTGIDL